jgi:hypothetical protein
LGHDQNQPVDPLCRNSARLSGDGAVKMKITSSIAFLTVGLLLAAISTAVPNAQTRRATPAASAAGAANTDELFEKIFPVFAHPRCANCHGIVEELDGKVGTASPASHPAEPGLDPQPDEDCGMCHNEPEDVRAAGWDLAPLHFRWAGKVEEQLCVMQATEVRKRNARAGGRSRGSKGSYLFHLTNDPFITQAFTGTAGGARDPEPPLPTPPMDREQFLAAATAWVDAGAPCRSTGVISQIETFAAHYKHTGPAGDDVTVTASANRHVDVTRYADGTATAAVSGGGEETTISVLNVDGCAFTTRTTNRWRIENGQNDPASPRQIAARVTTKIADGWYEVTAFVPADRTIGTGVVAQTNTCGVPLINESLGTTDLTWEPWEITIRCRTDVEDGEMFCLPREPQEFSMASGILKRTIVGFTHEPAWLSVSPAGIGRNDGTSLPIQSTTSWFLNFSN